MCELFLNARYKQERSENLSEYLNAKGVPWLVRKLISGKMDNGYFELTKMDESNFKITLGTYHGNLDYQFEFEKPLIGTGYDGKQHEITFAIKDNVLIEKHKHLQGDRKGEDEDITEWKFIDGQLIAETPATSKDGNKVIWVKYFKKL